MLETFRDFKELTFPRKDFLWVHGKKTDIGGGVFDVSEIDQIDEYDNMGMR